MGKVWKKTWNDKGRPLKYTKESFTDKVNEYIAIKKSQDLPITVLNFCSYADINKDYIQEHNIWDWTEYDFSVAIKKLKTEAEGSIEYLAMTHRINTNMAKFSLQNNYNWSERSQTDFTTGWQKLPTSIQIISPHVDNTIPPNQ